MAVIRFDLVDRHAFFRTLDVCTAIDANSEQWNIGIIGLGGGAMSSYAKQNQHWTFYELNPAVIDIATKPEYFSYLHDCVPHHQINAGDARLVLDREKKPQYDLLIEEMIFILRTKKCGREAAFEEDKKTLIS